MRVGVRGVARELARASGGAGAGHDASQVKSSQSKKVKSSQVECNYLQYACMHYRRNFLLVDASAVCLSWPEKRALGLIHVSCPDRLPREANDPCRRVTNGSAHAVVG